MKFVKTIFKGQVVGLTMLAGGLAPSVYGQEPGEPFSADLIAEGNAIFDELGCAGCHAPDEPIEGNTAPKLENLGERYTVEDIMALLDAPPGPMPRFDLDTADKRALAAYLLTTY